MSGDRRIFAAGLLLSGALHAALLLGVRSAPPDNAAVPARVQPLALVAVPVRAATPPPEAARPVLPPARTPAPPERLGAVSAAAPAVEPSAAPGDAALVISAWPPAAQVAPAATVPVPREVDARHLAQGRYEQTIAQSVERQRTYPLAARRRGWEGTAIVRLRLAADGTLLMAQLVRDTGFALLDEAALGMVRRAAPFPRLPEEIGEPHLEVLVPVHFSLGS